MKVIVISYEGVEASALTQKALLNVLIARGICDGNGRIYTLDEKDIAKLVVTHCLVQPSTPEPEPMDVNDAIMFLLNIFANEQKKNNMFFTQQHFPNAVEELLDNQHLSELHKANLIKALKSIAALKRVRIREEYLQCGFNINTVRLIKQLCERRKL